MAEFLLPHLGGQLLVFKILVMTPSSNIVLVGLEGRLEPPHAQ